MWTYFCPATVARMTRLIATDHKEQRAGICSGMAGKGWVFTWDYLRGYAGFKVLNHMQRRVSG